MITLATKLQIKRNIKEKSIRILPTLQLPMPSGGRGRSRGESARKCSSSSPPEQDDGNEDGGDDGTDDDDVDHDECLGNM